MIRWWDDYELYMQPRAKMIIRYWFTSQIYHMSIQLRYFGMAYIQIFPAWFWDIYVYEYILFLGNYTGFTERGYSFWEKNGFEKDLFYWPTQLCFSPLQVLSSVRWWHTRISDVLTKFPYVGSSGVLFPFSTFCLTARRPFMLWFCKCTMNSRTSTLP